MQRGLLTALAQRRHRQLDEARRSREILGGQREADRVSRRPLPLMPRARAPMQGRDLIGLLRQQARAEHVGKEVVVAIPPSRVVQRHEKEVAALQRLQPRAAALLAGDGFAEGAVQPVEDGGLEQEARIDSGCCRRTSSTK